MEMLEATPSRARRKAEVFVGVAGLAWLDTGRFFGWARMFGNGRSRPVASGDACGWGSDVPSACPTSGRQTPQKTPPCHPKSQQRSVLAHAGDSRMLLGLFFPLPSVALPLRLITLVQRRFPGSSLEGSRTSPGARIRDGSFPRPQGWASHRGRVEGPRRRGAGAAA